MAERSTRDDGSGVAEVHYATLIEIETAARLELNADVAHYFSAGAGNETTRAANEDAWKHLWLVPRRLTGVSDVSTTGTVLGCRLASPIMVAPMASQRLAHSEGELATARAAAEAGVLMVVSTSTNVSVEELSQVPNFQFWYQLYPFRDFEGTIAMVDRAIAGGASAICVTVDVAQSSDPRRQPSFGFDRPGSLEYPMHPDESDSLRAFDWSYLNRLRERISVPLVVKGILHPADAERAVDEGIDGIIVSNHGGRWLDGAVPTCLALSSIVAAVGDKAEILVDGGIRSGADVLRAVALGAKAVLVGRPFIWGLAAAGQAGVARVIEILQHEVMDTALLCGISDLASASKALTMSTASAGRP